MKHQYICCFIFSLLLSACIILCVLANVIQVEGAGLIAAVEKEVIRPPELNEVMIGSNGISIPLERVLLVRKGSEYCAIRFKKTWTGRTPEDQYATYESYYQGDGSGNFSNKNVGARKGKLDSPRGFPMGGGHRFSFWKNEHIQCGPIKLFWSYKTWVCFFPDIKKQGDFGIELAPTKWTDISQVNVFDSRLKWYRYDEKRKDIYVPIDQLWEDK